MAILFKPLTDRVKLKIGDIEFTISPLTYGQKSECANVPLKQYGGVQSVDLALLTHRIVKYAVKEVKGIELTDGSEYKLEFEELEFDGILKSQKSHVLTDECAEELILGLTISPTMQTIAYQLLGGIPDKILDNEGNLAKGVKIEVVKGKHKNAKKKTK